MVKKKKKKRRKSRFNNISINKTEVDESPQQMRAKYPKSLIDAYVNLHNTAVKVDGIYQWREATYKKYVKEAAKYLGKDKATDLIDAGKLIVNLYRATLDLKNKHDVEEKKTKKKKVKKIQRVKKG